MGKSKKKIDPLPDHFNSLEEAGEFWDTHDTTDYEEYMIPAHFDVDLKGSVHEVRVVHELLEEVTKIARENIPQKSRRALGMARLEQRKLKYDMDS
jgi:hypothetical protein